MSTSVHPLGLFSYSGATSFFSSCHICDIGVQCSVPVQPALLNFGHLPGGERRDLDKIRISKQSQICGARSIDMCRFLESLSGVPFLTVTVPFTDARPHGALALVAWESQ
jgi:hypothetical protein